MIAADRWNLLHPRDPGTSARECAKWLVCAELSIPAIPAIPAIPEFPEFPAIPAIPALGDSIIIRLVLLL